jgi:hypothetical protein
VWEISSLSSALGFEMKHWRVTKYDPAVRDSSGAYGQDEWTDYDDIGKTFGGVLLTMSAYMAMEDRYVEVATQFVREAGVSELVAVGVEQNGNHGLVLSEGMRVIPDTLVTLVRAILRHQVWCMLEWWPHFYLHIGYDYYMYFGCENNLPNSIKSAMENGLFVEEEISPYLQWG